MNHKKKHQSPFNLNNSKLSAELAAKFGCQWREMKWTEEWVWRQSKSRWQLLYFSCCSGATKFPIQTLKKKCISSTPKQGKERPDRGHQLLPPQLWGGASSSGSSPGPGRFRQVQLHQFGPVSVQWKSHQPGHGGLLLLLQLHQEGISETSIYENEYPPIFKFPSEKSLKLLPSVLLSFSSISVTVLQNPRSPGGGPQRVGSVWCYGPGGSWDHWNTPSWHPGHHQRPCTRGSPGKSELKKC